MDFWNRIPTKFLLTVTLAAFLFLCVLIWYAVIYKNTPVEIFGIVKFGERDDALRARLVKAQTDAETRIAPEVHNAVLAKLKDAESKTSGPKIEASKLKLQVKEREDKIAELDKTLAQTKAGLDAARNDLLLSRKHSQELTSQVSELKKQVEETSLINKKKSVRGFVQQLYELEKSVGGSKDPYTAQAYARAYNEILTAVQKELPNDAYVQSTNPLSGLGTTESIEASSKNAFSRLRVYLEERYLK